MPTQPLSPQRTVFGHLFAPRKNAEQAFVGRSPPGNFGTHGSAPCRGEFWPPLPDTPAHPPTNPAIPPTPAHQLPTSPPAHLSPHAQRIDGAPGGRSFTALSSLVDERGAEGGLAGRASQSQATARPADMLRMRIVAAAGGPPQRRALRRSRRACAPSWVRACVAALLRQPTRFVPM